MILKSAAELNALKEKAKDKFAVKQNGMKIIVGMATCGMAAGAKPVLEMLNQEIKSKNLENITIAQAGCIGLCQYEPIVEILESGKEKVTYVNVDSKKVKEIVTSHIIEGKIIPDYTIGAATASVK